MAAAFRSSEAVDLVGGRSHRKAIIAVVAVLALALAAAGAAWALTRPAEKPVAAAADPCLRIEATAQDYDASTSTPLLATATKGDYSTTCEVSVNSGATEIWLAPGEWTVALVPPVNADGTTYAAPAAKSVSAGDDGTVTIDGEIVEDAVKVALEAADLEGGEAKRARCSEIAGALASAGGDLAERAGTYTSLAYSYLGVTSTQAEADEIARQEAEAAAQKQAAAEAKAEEKARKEAEATAKKEEQERLEAEKTEEATSSEDEKEETSSPKSTSKEKAETTKTVKTVKTKSCSHKWEKIRGYVKHSAQYETRYVCVTCSKEFRTAVQAQEHIDAEHYNAAGKTGYRQQLVKVKKAYKTYGVKYLKCSKCGKKKAASSS